MRPSHIEARLEQQLSLKDLISNSVENLVKIGQSNVRPQRARARLSALQEAWEKFSIIHEAIFLAMTKITPGEKVLLQQHSYFLEDSYSTTYECYLEAIERMSSFLEHDTESITDTPSTQSSSQILNAPVYFHHARLPRIDIPKFNGSPSEWLSFKDLFNSLIIANPTLTSVEKLQYLKTSLVGSASHLLKNTALTADNFQKAWDSLISFYENKRLLVHSALHSLMTLKRMTKESAAEMEQLYTNVTQIYRALDTLGRPVQTWDDIFVFIVVQRLDAESVKTWEHLLGSSKEPPTWNQLLEFLLSRLLSLQAFEKSRTGKSSNAMNSTSSKSHFQRKAKETQVDKNTSCILCSAHHYIASCPQYHSKSLQQRQTMVQKNKLCYNCLGHHKVSTCRTTKRCLKCGQKHHTTLHQKPHSPVKPSAEPSTSENSSDAKEKESHSLHTSVNQFSVNSSVLLATAQVLVVTKEGDSVQARALIDQGSELTLISEHLVQVLRLPRKNSFISLIGVGGKGANRTKGITSFKVKSRFDSTTEIHMSAHILANLTSSLPSVQVPVQNWPHLKGLDLADHCFMTPGPVDIIIGADFYSQIIEDGLIKGDATSPIAQLTKFGWILSGPVSFNSDTTFSQGYHLSVDKDLYDLLQQFWKVEDIIPSNTSQLSVDEQRCEHHYKETHSRDEEGRYIVRLPFKRSPDVLGGSRLKALRVMYSLSQRFANDPSYAKAYSEFLSEYHRLDHMILVPDHQSEPELSYYLPHHGVLRETSTTTKLRVVFNGSNKTTSGLSLNDILYTGEKLQTDVFDVLLWFRKFLYVFSTDMEKMYRQIKLHKDDWTFQRILWLNQDKDVETYQLTTVTYGLACAPFLALRTLAQLIEDEGDTFPHAIPSLKKGRYVDDIFGGADTIPRVKEIVQQVNSLCKAGGFSLQKWTSNEPSILESIPSAGQASLPFLQFNQSTAVQVLGLQWNPKTDSFHYSVATSIPTIISKRVILSTIAKIFDPLGLVAPVLITAKIFIQELWAIKLGWDDALPITLSQRWIAFIEQLKDIPKLKFPRWIAYTSECSIELHGFCDASQKAICATVYLRSSNVKGEVATSLICSKTKVAPLKKMTIPRLELLGACLLTNLISRVLQALEFKEAPIILWTDSSVVYTWINGHPSRWKDFVRNRVCSIHETLPQAIWRFIPGKDNPADCATRGLTPTQLSTHSIWNFGPNWLKQPHQRWPQEPQSQARVEGLEENPKAVLGATQSNHELWDLLFGYSSLARLLRITALCIGFTSRLRKSSQPFLLESLTPQELETATMYWIGSVQDSFFHQERRILLGGNSLPTSSGL
ncbi:uncharacterized protein, partial [Mycetomoellerius zeteki]|uniref:uncharacterized protein n=1 Tax=Mycetomoellerius zeteki TaxID=64791 RepID=UPI00084EA9BE